MDSEDSKDGANENVVQVATLWYLGRLGEEEYRESPRRLLLALIVPHS